MTDTAARPVLVVDFGAQYAQLIARRVREASVYSEIVPHTITAAEVAAKNPVGIVLSGGPASVYEPGSPDLDPAILQLGVPVMASATASRSWRSSSAARSHVPGDASTGRPLCASWGMAACCSPVSLRRRRRG